METSEMMDVIHYLFEEDAGRYTSGEQAEAVSAMRTQLYMSYGKTYRYAVSSKSKSGRTYMPKDASDDYGFNDITDSGELKPYIPPTEFNPDSAMPFGGDIEAPLG